MDQKVFKLGIIFFSNFCQETIQNKTVSDLLKNLMAGIYYDLNVAYAML